MLDYSDCCEALGKSRGRCQEQALWIFEWRGEPVPMCRNHKKQTEKYFLRLNWKFGEIHQYTFREIKHYVKETKTGS